MSVFPLPVCAWMSTSRCDVGDGGSEISGGIASRWMSVGLPSIPILSRRCVARISSRPNASNEDALDDGAFEGADRGVSGKPAGSEAPASSLAKSDDT